MEKPVPVAIEPVLEPVAPAPEPVVEKVAEPEEPEVVPQDTMVADAAPADDATRVNAANAYDELDGKSGPQVGESIPANVENEEDSHVVRWVILGVSSAVCVTGAVLAVVGNSKAKNAAEKSFFANQHEFNKSRDDAKSGETIRSVGIGLAIVGAVGVGVSFAF